MSAPTVPYAIAAERAVLGAIFRDPKAIDAVAEWLKPDMFGLEANAWVYEAMLVAHTSRRPPDRIIVAQILDRGERLAPIGGESALIDLMREVPHAAHIEHHAGEVERTALLRRLIETGAKVATLGYQSNRAIDDVAAEAEAELARALAGRTRAEKAVKINAVLNDLYERIGDRAEGTGLLGLPTGYPDLDELTGGLQPSDLIILAARPGIGKTSLALSLAYNVALRVTSDERGQALYLPGTPVGIFSFEMSRDQLVQRLLSMHTGIDLQRLRTRGLRGDELDATIAGMGHLSEAPIYVDDTPGLSIRDVQRRARRLHNGAGLGLLIIDYLQLMSGERVGRNDGRVQEVSEISRGCKALARELNIPVIALSQLSRAVEGRQSKVPMLSDLRESGSLEQDADIVWFIYRDEKYDPNSDKKGIAEIHMAKHRNGPEGVVTLRFESRTTRFESRTTRFEHLSKYVAPEGY